MDATAILLVIELTTGGQQTTYKVPQASYEACHNFLIDSPKYLEAMQGFGWGTIFVCTQGDDWREVGLKPMPDKLSPN